MEVAERSLCGMGYHRSLALETVVEVVGNAGRGCYQHEFTADAIVSGIEHSSQVGGGAADAAGHPLPAGREDGLPSRAALHEVAKLVRKLWTHMVPLSLGWYQRHLLYAMTPRAGGLRALHVRLRSGFARRDLRFHPAPALVADGSHRGAPPLAVR